jgi:hypothetical protein
MGWRTVAPVCAVVTIAAVDELLFGVVADNAGDLAEADLNGCDAGKGGAGAALKLILYRTHQTCSTRKEGLK